MEEKFSVTGGAQISLRGAMYFRQRHGVAETQAHKISPKLTNTPIVTVSNPSETGGGGAELLLWSLMHCYLAAKQVQMKEKYWEGKDGHMLIICR